MSAPHLSSLGAHLGEDNCSFRVWAPHAQRAQVLIQEAQLQPRRYALTKTGDGYFVGTVPDIQAGTLYRYSLENQAPWPDPCTRFQPSGPHGPSMVVDPHAHRWRDNDWRGITLNGQVLYELHVGCFTGAGTFAAATDKLPHLKSLGITTIELMPIVEFAGRRNWGYDGVCLFAPSHHYGEYAALQRFVDCAHQMGLGVILDVVYNHLGPDGNYLPQYSPFYFSKRHVTEWGIGFNFDGEHAQEVRDFIISNVCEWLTAFHLDGFRLDATQSIFDDSSQHIMAELTQRAHAAAWPRSILIIAENEPQHASQLLPTDRHGMGLDAMWNDDFHHSARVAATGKRHAYYHDYGGTAQEFVSTAKRGFLYQGQYYPWQRQCRGQPMQAPHAACIIFLENHDQVANSLSGARLHQLTSPGRHRCLTALLLLAPQTPLLFMGQEFQCSRPFLYFADHAAPLTDKVFAGRKEFLRQFRGIDTDAAQNALPDPAADTTFEHSHLDWSELDSHDTALRLHRDLLMLRRTDPVINAQAQHGLDGAALGANAFLLRWFDDLQGDRLLLINLGVEIPLQPMPEPLLASPLHSQWSLLWSSDDIRYGGGGIENPCTETGWFLPGESAVLFKAVRSKQGQL